MGLFAKQPIRLTQTVPYTIVMGDKAILLIGLGNPGSKYKNNRHNIGFEVLDYFALANNFPDWKDSDKFKGSWTESKLGNSKVILLKPNTYMNLSGEAANALSSFYKIQPINTIVIHDDLDLPFGQIRIRGDGNSGGHKGIESVIDHIGKQFGRIRIGISNDFSDKQDSSDFVLSDFTKDEKEMMITIFKETASIITEFIYSGKLNPETRNLSN